MQSVNVFCDRCKNVVSGKVGNGGSAGFYNVEETIWSKYANPGEKHICDGCMWDDDRYKTDYAMPVAVVPVPAYEVIHQSIQHTLAIAELFNQVENRAVQWVDDYTEEHTGAIELEKFRGVAYEKACSLYDGEDDCILADICEGCDPTDYEANVLITAFVLTAIEYLQHNYIISVYGSVE